MKEIVIEEFNVSGIVFDKCFEQYTNSKHIDIRFVSKTFTDKDDVQVRIVFDKAIRSNTYYYCYVYNILQKDVTELFCAKNDNLNKYKITYSKGLERYTNTIFTKEDIYNLLDKVSNIK